MKISAYIPAFNNRGTIASTIASIRAQSVPVDELFVVDDGSTDGTAGAAASLGIRVVAFPANQGRGAARALAMTEAAHELVLCCDAAMTLDPGFVKNALPWFDDARVAAVFGWVTQPPPADAAGRWRGRHLFKTPITGPQRRAKLATGGAVLRASAAGEVGGFNTALRLAEDADLGARLLAADYDVILDPKLTVISAVPNTLAEALERYWRWNTAPYGRMGAGVYLRQIVYSIKVMAREDLLAHDPAAALISLICPHYQFWKSVQKRRK
jgi:glycosyltransferase involved in cell wall biosynthesis